MSQAKAVLQGLLLMAGIWLAGELAWTVHRVRPHLEVTLSNLDRTIIVAGAAATHLEKASGTWESSSKTQALETTRAMSNLSLAAGKLSGFISRTDNSLNSVMLPTLTAIITQQSQSLLENQKGLQVNLADSHKLLVDADAQINSPDVKIALDNMATSSANLAAATNEAAASMKDIRTGLDYELKQLMAPVTKAKAALNLSLLVIRRLFF